MWRCCSSIQRQLLKRLPLRMPQEISTSRHQLCTFTPTSSILALWALSVNVQSHKIDRKIQEVPDSNESAMTQEPLKAVLFVSSVRCLNLYKSLHKHYAQKLIKCGAADLYNTLTILLQMIKTI